MKTWEKLACGALSTGALAYLHGLAGAALERAGERHMAGFCRGAAGMLVAASLLLLLASLIDSAGPPTHSSGQKPDGERPGKK